MYRVELTELSDNPDRLRDRIIRGWTDHMPTVGSIFELAGPPRDSDRGMRLVTTSPVVRILSEYEGTIEFETENSRYQVEERCPDC